MNAQLAFHPDGLDAAKRARTAGLCLFCEEPIPPRLTRGRKREICNSVACRYARWRAWHRDDMARRTYWIGCQTIKRSAK